MKTNVSPRAPQGVRSKAPVRSTSARARSTPAKPLRPVDAPAPAPAPTPAPASSPTAAPPTIEGAPRLSPAHRALAEGLSTALLRLAEARQGIEGLAIDASNDTLSRASALEMAEATLEALAYLSDAQEAARRLALGQHIEPRDLPDLRANAQDLALCLDQLGGELGRCCHQLTGLGGGCKPHSLAANARDLAAVIGGLRAQLRPERAAEDASTQRFAARIAAEHFARSA